MADDAVADFVCEVQPPAFPLQFVHNPQALLAVPETEPIALEDLIDNLLPCMSEGSVPQVMGQGDGLSKILIEAQASGNGPGYLRDL